MTRKDSAAGTRKNFGAGVKAKVAIEAMRGERTVAEPGTKQLVHRTLIDNWTRRALEGMPGLFPGKVEV